ncbi:MAG: glycosyltransferase family 2 protein [Candidatus Omnitrophota bacterium]
MDFIFSGNNLTGKERVLQRAFEILPGLTSWTIITGMAVLSFLCPFTAAVIIIAFYFYWILRLSYLTFFLILSYFRLSSERDTDWMKRLRGLDNIDAYLEKLNGKPLPAEFKKKISFLAHRGEVKKLKLSGAVKPLLSEVFHLAVIPVAKETKDVVEPGVRSLIEGTFPPRQIIVILALEERAAKEVKEGAEKLKEEYKGHFFDMRVIVHPDGRPGEARAKGANTSFAAVKAAEYLKAGGIPFENVVCSCFDSDTVVDRDYFSALTYYFLTCPERDRASFQPVPVYNNNIWDAPAITRVLETGSSFFQLIEATNPETLVTFSSHSMSFKALTDVGYWPVDMISDDSAIYWKSFMHFNGNYKVVPMYTTLSMDAVVAGTWWQTVINVYRQKRRWAWGVENFPIVMRAFLKNRGIPFHVKLKSGFKLFEGHISWTTWAFLLTIIGWLPAIFAGKEFSHSVFYYSAPRISGTIFRLATFSLLTSIIISLMLLPAKKEKHPVLKRLGFAFQWLLVPVTMLFLSALPALDAQTRLMFGKYMTFRVTDKGRKGKHEK